jgi:DNA mismatch repair ATPase MutS
MAVVVYLPNKGVKEISLGPESKIGELIKAASPATVGLTDEQEDQEVYLLDESDELSKDSKIKDHKAFVIHRCKKVLVTIMYPGKQPYTHAYPPSTLLKHIRKDAIKKFNIDDAAGQNLEIFQNENQNSKLNRNYPVGTFTDYPTCGVKLYLADPNAFAG